jgi:hypothetical protein
MEEETRGRRGGLGPGLDAKAIEQGARAYNLVSLGLLKSLVTAV